MIVDSFLLLQFSWFIDYVPAWLSPTLMGVGLLIMVLTFVSFSTSGNESVSVSLETVALSSVGLGVAFLSIPLYRNHTYIFAAGCLLAGRWIEGVAATRLLTKVVRFLTGSKTTDLGSLLKRRLRRVAIILSVVILTAWAATWVLIFNPGTPTRVYELTLLWTVFVGVISLLGLGFKFTSVDARIYSIQIRFVPMVFGLIIAIVGAQLYNFELLTQVISVGGAGVRLSAFDPLLLFLGYFSYLAGYYWSIRRRLSAIG